MKISKKMLALLTSVVALMSAGCGSNGTASSVDSNSSETSVGGSMIENNTSVEDTLQEPEVLTEVSINVAENIQASKQSDRVVRTMGRTFFRNGGLACDFSCTGIKFTAACKGVVSVAFTTSANCYFTVYIDGVRVSERLLVQSKDNGKPIAVAEFEEYGEREISIVKQSQYAMALCEINEVKLLGSFGKRPAQKERFIEFYGDSILNGSNIYMGGTSTATSDATYAFGYLTALALNADCNIIGRGGMGLYPKDSSTDGMNEIWEYCGGTTSNAPLYDFGRTPDVVVVELGCNDVVSDRYTDARYKESIRVMVDNLRGIYGNEMKIIWCYGLNATMDEKWPLVKETLDGLNADGNILYCLLPNASLSKAEGGDGWHPNQEMSKDIADSLTDFIEKNIYS